ncbi:MAG: TIGR00270 family protein [Thermoplasmata archaeon]|nr:MAG: TIGR00270 family protein [Thermoplasmata archaeon]
MTQCELCGKESPDCRLAIVDGVKMMVCPKCLSYGKEVPRIVPPSIKSAAKKKISTEDIYKKMDKELVPDWNQRIKDARMKKNLTREQLGALVGERTVTIAKIENGDLRPSDETIKKLEKILGITLLEEIKNVIVRKGGGSKSSGLTLGDLLGEKLDK